MKRMFHVATLLAVMTAGFAFAHTGATGIVKERMDAMGEMGDKSKIVAKMFKGEIEFNGLVLADAADAFVKHGNRMVTLFPDTKMSRTGHKTEALPIIWDEWQKFNDMVDEFIFNAYALQKITATTEDTGKLRKAFLTTLNNCSGCHKRFRKPKK